MRLVLTVCTLLCLLGCKDGKQQVMTYGPKGSAGMQSPIQIYSQGNEFGYYEYLPNDFIETQQNWPIIIYWNGSNAITGNGVEDLPKLLTQGLPQLINDGNHYPAIIISPMLDDWKTNNVHNFVEYILERYENNIDQARVYMSGFSAGGGVTVKYAATHPEKLAAIIPIAPAINAPNNEDLTPEFADVSSWFFHNSGDMVVEVWRSNVWHHELMKLGGEHKITRPDVDSHYAWQYAYNSELTWNWLFNQIKNKEVIYANK